MKKITNKNQFNTLADLRNFLKKHYKSVMGCKGKIISDILFYEPCTICLKFTDGSFCDFFHGHPENLYNSWKDDPYIGKDLTKFLLEMGIVDNKTHTKMNEEIDAEDKKYKKNNILKKLSEVEETYKNEKAKLKKLLL